jgi:hypothetical protein
MIQVIFIVILLTVAVFGQEGKQQKVIQAREFKGLNTRASDFNIQPNEARRAIDIDLSRGGIGSIQKRLGYDSVSTLVGMDSILAIYGAYYSDGTQQLVLTTDSDGTGYGGIYVTGKGSANIEADSSTRIWQYFSTQNLPSFTVLNDAVYIVNGTQKAVRWDGKQARPYPHPAPGEPLLVPISDGNELDGQYSYMFVTTHIDTVGTDTTWWLSSYPTSPVDVNSGQILITWLQWQRNDWMYPDSSQDSIQVLAYRTKANPVGQEGEVYAFLVDTISMLAADADTAGNIVYIDTTKDSELWPDSLLLHDPIIYSGENYNDGMRRYGSPGILNTTALVGNDSGIYDGTDTLPNGLLEVAGWEWRCTFVDTMTGQESNLGPPIAIKANVGANATVTIVLPVPPSTAPELVVNLYRAKILAFGFDSLQINPPRWWDPRFQVYRPLPPVWTYSRDSIYVDGDYYLINQFAKSDTLFIDSISWRTLKTNAIFHGESVPPLFRNIVSFEERLFGSEKSRLHFSKQLDNWFFEAFDFVPLNVNDGDEITMFFPSRGLIRGFKNHSNYNVYQDSDLEWKRTEISGYWGCIAPKSWAPGLIGHYYLSDNGVVRETEGLTLERTQTIELVSAPLDNFDKLPIITKSKGVGFYFDQKYMLSYPDLDTTYVYDERADAWTTWSNMTFSSATLYGVESGFGFFPGDTMYFVKSGDSTIYRYGSSEYDNNAIITAVWRSGPLLAGPQYKRITGIGMWRQSSDASDSLVWVLFNESDVQLPVTRFTDLTKRYSITSLDGGEHLYHTFLLGAGPRDSLPTTVIDGLDIYYIEGSPVETD